MDHGTCSTPVTLALVACCLAASLSAQSNPASATLAGFASGEAVPGRFFEPAQTFGQAIGFDAAQQVRKNRVRGALLGGGIGLVGGALLGGLSVQSDAGDGDPQFGEFIGDGAATAAGVVLGGLFGAGIGALLGATVFAPSENVPVAAVPGGSLHLATHVSPARVALGFRFQWTR